MEKNKHIEPLTGKHKRPVLSVSTRRISRKVLLPSTGVVAVPASWTLCKHPYSGKTDFGYVALTERLHDRFKVCHIVLEHGWHNYSSGKGKGLVHIAARHRHQITGNYSDDYAAVACFVSDILVDDTPVYCLGDEFAKQRLAVYRQGVGLIILGQDRLCNQDRWTIITAYPSAECPNNESDGFITMNMPNARI